MKAAVVVANEDVQYLEIPEPEVKPGYVKTVSYTHLDVYKRQVLKRLPHRKLYQKRLPGQPIPFPGKRKPRVPLQFPKSLNLRK